MSALPIEPTERDRERFRDITKAMRFGLEYDRRLATNGDYTDQQTVAMFRLWWSVERERQLLQNLNQSQGCKISELLGRAEEAEAELEAVREDNHSMMLEIHNLRIERDALVAELARLRGQEPVAYVKYKQTGGNVGLSWVAIPTGAFYPNEGDPLFASPVAAVPAPIPFIPDDDTRRNDEAYAAQQAAPSVPEEWRRVMAELADDLAIEIDQNYPPESRVYPSEQRRYKGEMEIVNRARALLQSASTGEPK